MIHRRSARPLLAAVLFLGALAPALAQEVSYKNLLQPLLDTNKTIVGETLAYPQGAARVNVSIVTVPPGGSTGWHVHPVPLVGYILEGELSVDYGEKGVHVYHTGEALLEAMATAHNGTNKGTVPVKILAVYLGADGMANAAAADEPKPH